MKEHTKRAYEDYKKALKEEERIQNRMKETNILHQVTGEFCYFDEHLKLNEELQKAQMHTNVLARIVIEYEFGEEEKE